MNVPSTWPRVAAAALLLTAMIALLVTAFAWPSVRSAPADVPLVAAPPAAAEQVQRQLDAARPGAFDVTAVADLDAARAALLSRDAYGAVVLGSQGPTVLTASAASAVVAQLLGQIASGLAAAPPAAESPAAASPAAASPAAGSPLSQDVVPLPAADPRGAGLVAAALPLTLGGILTAVALQHLVAGTWRRVAGVLLVAALGGTAVTVILQTWLGALGGGFTTVAAVLALALAAGGALVLSLGTWAGSAGTALGAATLVLLGNPLSGAAGAPELLPEGWGTLGQLLPPGAAVSAIRSVAYFDGAAAGGPLLVLGSWLVLGLTLCAVAALRDRKRPPFAAVTPVAAQAVRPSSMAR